MKGHTNFSPIAKTPSPSSAPSPASSIASEDTSIDIQAAAAAAVSALAIADGPTSQFIEVMSLVHMTDNKLSAKGHIIPTQEDYGLAPLNPYFLANPSGPSLAALNILESDVEKVLKDKTRHLALQPLMARCFCPERVHRGGIGVTESEAKAILKIVKHFKYMITEGLVHMESMRALLSYKGLGEAFLRFYPGTGTYSVDPEHAEHYYDYLANPVPEHYLHFNNSRRGGPIEDGTGADSLYFEPVREATQEIYELAQMKADLRAAHQHGGPLLAVTEVTNTWPINRPWKEAYEEMLAEERELVQRIPAEEIDYMNRCEYSVIGTDFPRDQPDTVERDQRIERELTNLPRVTKYFYDDIIEHGELPPDYKRILYKMQKEADLLRELEKPSRPLKCWVVSPKPNDGVGTEDPEHDKDEASRPLKKRRLSVSLAPELVISEPSLTSQVQK